MTTEMREPTAPAEDAEVRVWDPVVRIGHWTVVALFAIAYLTEGEVLTLHSWAGYGIGIYLIIRLIWGFIGTRHARFRDFAYGWRRGLVYFRDLLLFRSKRYVGHSPAGAIMVFALLISLTLTVLSGMTVLAVEKNRGPLAPWFGGVAAEANLSAAPAAAASERGEGEGEGGVVKEIHEVLSNLTLILVLAHVGGVIFASLAHRENLARAMVTGRKRAE
jgi:cytochrome b